jgi:hypothetical protein
MAGEMHGQSNFITYPAKKSSSRNFHNSSISRGKIWHILGFDRQENL